MNCTILETKAGLCLAILASELIIVMVEEDALVNSLQKENRRWEITWENWTFLEEMPIVSLLLHVIVEYVEEDVEEESSLY